MKYCKNCANAIFDQIFGDYKCSITQVSVDADSVVDCDDHVKGNPIVSKESPDDYLESAQ